MCEKHACITTHQHKHKATYRCRKSILLAAVLMQYGVALMQPAPLPAAFSYAVVEYRRKLCAKAARCSKIHLAVPGHMSN